MPQLPGIPGQPPGGGSGGPWDWVKDNALPLITGVLSTGGELYANQSNRAEAERNRQFQERMSSTAVQRSVEDYKKAGLNPGLAYDRSASSPGGNTATIGNPVNSGIASAQAARQISQALQIARDQNEADLRLKDRQTAAANASAERDTATAEGAAWQARLNEQQFRFNSITQPITKKLMETDAVMKELGIPEAKNKADFERMLGTAKPGIATAKTFAEILKILFQNH